MAAHQNSANENAKSQVHLRTSGERSLQEHSLLDMVAIAPAASIPDKRAGY
jgi:hypothetical protein